MSNGPVASALEQDKAAPPRLATPGGWVHEWVWAAPIFALVLVVYWPVLRGEFVWDDLLTVAKNPLVTGQFTLRSVWFQMDFPLTTVGLWLEWLAFAKHAPGYHVVNVLLHGLDAVLLWRVLKRLRVPGAWLAGVLFAVHPVCVASAAWISELKNTLSLAFYLLSFLCFVRSGGDKTSNSKIQVPSGKDSSLAKVRGEPSTRSWLSYLLSVISFVLALLAKTSTVMLPVVLLGWTWWRAGRITRRDVLRVSPYFALSLAFGLMTVWFQRHQVITGGPVQAENFFGRLAGAGLAVWFYLGKALLPLHLNMIYPRWTIHGSSPGAYLPLLLLSFTLGACVWFRRSWGRHALFGLGCFIANLFPVLGFFDMYYLAISRVSDHFQYVAIFAPLVLIAAAWPGMPWRRAFFCAVVLAFSCLTFQRARVFATDEGLWRDTLAKNPAAWPAHNNLGCILAEQKKYGPAIEHFEASLNINPRNAGAQANLAETLMQQGRLAEAEPHFRAALALKPDSFEAHRYYAAALVQAGRSPEALPHLRAALTLQADLDTRLDYASLLYQTGNLREAIDQFRRVLSLRPDSTLALNNLAWLLATAADPGVRNGAEAVRWAERACQLTSYKQAPMLATLATAYAEAGRFPEAIRTCEMAAQAAGNAGDTHSATKIRHLLSFYRAGKPWHEVPIPKPP